MKKKTRFAFNAYLQQLARLNSVEVEELSSKFTVEPSVQQTLEDQIQQSAAFLTLINITPVTVTLKRLSGFISAQQIRLVTLSGGVGPYMTGIGQLDAACSVSIMPAPLRASSQEIACTLRNENSVRDVMLTAQAADAAIVGIGAINQKDQASILKSGYITQGEQLMIGRKGAVGDILGYFFDAHGEIIPDIKIHNELIGLKLNSLSTIPTVIGVAGGEQKAEAIIAAMRGNYINALVTDQKTAGKIIQIIEK